MKNMSITELRTLLKDKKVSAKEITEYYVNQIKVASDVNAFITVNEKILTEAEMADKRISEGENLPLLGIPVAVKDNICTFGIRTTCASRILENYNPVYTATAVENLIKAGAIIIGKTNLDEFGMGSSCENSIFGATKNPHNLLYSPGGSSGGSAAAVGAGLAPFALGSDTGGSVRQPSANCGIVGMKPTYGAVSRYGLVAFASSLDQIGPMTKTVADNALVLSLMQGRDVMDMTSLGTKTDRKKIAGLRFGIVKEFTEIEVSPEVKASLKKAEEALCALGMSPVEISLPHIKYALEAYYIISSAEASSNLARFDGVRYGRRSENYGNITELYKASRGEGFGTEVKRRIMLGTFVLSSGYSDKYYKNALRIKKLIEKDFELAFEECDFIISPVTPFGPKLLGAKSDPVSTYREDIFTVPANLAGIPAMSIPWGKTEKAMPLGLQLMGRKFDEDLLYSVGEALEKGGEF